MKILMAAAEYAPLAKTGGLADAVSGLAHALFGRGHDVRVLLPRYPGMADIEVCAEIAAGEQGTRFLEVRTRSPGPRVYLAAQALDGTPDRGAAADGPGVAGGAGDAVGAHSGAQPGGGARGGNRQPGGRARGGSAQRGGAARDGGDAHAPVGATIYTGDDRDAARFLHLSRAALALGPALGWRPDVLHCHDWHAALVPAFGVAARRKGGGRDAVGSGEERIDEVRGASGAAEERSASGAAEDRRAGDVPPSVLTVHNLGYQGIFAEHVLAENGGTELAALRSARTLAQHTVNFLELGIGFADSITTVSPTYAREIQRPEFGMGLDEALHARGTDVVGILNGVDYRLWSPETDPYLDAHYTRTAPAPKQLVKRALEADLGLPSSSSALVGCVTRLVWQKGIDVLAAALPELLAATNARFALLGSGEPELERALAELAARHPERIAFKRGYDEALAHRILAGSDFVVVPSRYEPCGLTQLYALRYGTVPIVRATGGLADSVRHFDARTGAGNGSVFEHADTGGIVWGVTTALGWYEDSEAWAKVVANAMSCDFSWARQAPEYEALYARIVAAAGTRP
jgi:starch synthase